MEELSGLLFLIVILLIVSLRSYLRKRLDLIELEMRRMREHIYKPETGTTGVALVVPEGTTRENVPLHVPAQPVSPVSPEPLSVELEALLRNTPAIESTPAPAPEALSTPIPDPDIIAAAARARPKVKTPSFLERNPDLEKFIGENLISKIGIAILVLAIGFFVKYAIDNEWIGAVGRVGVGILCGGILIAVAHRMRNSYNAFSSVLVGGGLAIFYFTIALAFHQFGLFSQTVSFIIMVVITGFAVTLSQLYNRQELAVIALVGGFATPLILNTGSGNYKALFLYLIILNAGLLAIAYSKAWRLLNLLAFIFTVILFGSWLYTLDWYAMEKTGVTQATYRNGLLFATVFYLMFLIINIAHNIRKKKKFIASDFGILLADTGLYFAAGLYCLTLMKAGAYKGLFTASMGIFNLGATYLLFRNRKIDKNILYLLIGITLSFISLTAPIQLNGHNITLFWACESVLLYWLYQKSSIPIIRLSSRIVWAAMLASLVMDWYNVYGDNYTAIPVLLNRGFITTVFAATACCILFMLSRRDNAHLPTTGIHIRSVWFGIAGALLFYAAGIFEMEFQFTAHYPGSNLYVLYLLLYTNAFVLALNVVTAKIFKVRLYWEVEAGLLALCILLYTVCIQQTFNIQSQMLQQHQHLPHFKAHWAGALLLAAVLYRLIALLRVNRPAISAFTNPLTWILCAAAIVFLSVEMHLLSNNIFYNNRHSLYDIQSVYRKTGLPILWGLCSFGFMWLGMRHKFRMLRIISLFLFSIILIKLFVFDIRNIPVAGKIAAFFSLGILLLVVSFMYQRLKKIIIEDEKRPTA